MAAPTVFQRAHIWLTDNANDELLSMGAQRGVDGLDNVVTDLVRNLGFSAFTVKMLDGHSEVNSGYIWKLKEIRARLGLRFVVGAWSQNRADAVGEAQHAAALCASQGVDYWEPCGEDDYYKGDPGTEPWRRSKQWASTFHALRPGMTKGFVSLPNEPRGSFYDWAAWRDIAARWVPECNPGYHADAPTQWPFEAQQVGSLQFFKSYVHPLLGFQFRDGTPRPTVGQHLDSLRRAKMAGFTWGYGIYYGHVIDSKAEWDLFGTVNKPAGTKDALAWYPA